MQPSRRRRRKNPLASVIPALLFILAILIIVASTIPQKEDPSMEQTSGSSSQGTSSTQSNSSGQTTSATQSTGSTQSTETTQSTTSTQAPPTSSETTAPTPVDLEEFFSETVFIGDSITYGLSTYCNIYKPLYGAKFLCASSYAVRHAIVDPEPGNENIVSVKYQGVSMRPEEALAQMGAKRVFIMLGLNDISFGVDYTIGNWRILIENIQAACPDIEIFIQSATPLHANRDNPANKLCNNNMNTYNEKLQALCAEMGCRYVDVASALKDENGQLKDEYCSDQYCHMSYAGIDVWIQTLKNYVLNMNNE